MATARGIPGKHSDSVAMLESKGSRERGSKRMLHFFLDASHRV